VHVSRASFWCEFLVRVSRASVMGLRPSQFASVFSLTYNMVLLVVIEDASAAIINSNETMLTSSHQ